MQRLCTHTYILSFSSIPALLELVVVVEDEVVSLDVLFSGFLTSCDISTLIKGKIKNYKYKYEGSIIAKFG